jgi:hypothetical protein
MLLSRLVVKGATACLATLICWSTAQAQINLTGSWSTLDDQDFDLRVNGPWPDSFMGIPINQAARTLALAYTPETVSEIDRQCEPWSQAYMVTGGQGASRIWPTVSLDGTVIAWNIGGEVDRMPLTIWMDGRSPPSPQAANTAGGFATGRWAGDTLVATITKMQAGYMTRNGVPISDRAVMTLFLTRHENIVTVTAIIRDPVYLAAPYVLSGLAADDLTGPVRMGTTVDATCQPEEEDQSVSNAQVPTFLTPPAIQSQFATQNYGIPHEAAMGGPQTMYPEYLRQINAEYKRPQQYCTTNCCGEMSGQAPGGTPLPVYNNRILKCKQFLP